MERRDREGSTDVVYLLGSNSVNFVSIGVQRVIVYLHLSSGENLLSCRKIVYESRPLNCL